MRQQWGFLPRLWWRIYSPFVRAFYTARRAWLAAFSDQHVLVEYEELMELTSELEEHPEGWENPCACALCRSYS